MAMILLIEDDPDILANVSEMLALAGHRVLEAANGKDGIALARSGNPMLIVCDVMMPGIDGFGVLHILKSSPQTRHIPFIFLTSKHDPTDFRHAIHLGANDFITKPFDTSDLLDAIERILTSAAADASPPSENAGAGRPACSDPAREPVDLQPFHLAIEGLKADCEVAAYAKKHIVYKEESYPRYLYFVQSGKLKAIRNHQDGKELIVDLYTVGDFVGYAPLFNGAYHIETTEVIEDCELVLIPRKKFEELAARNSAVMKYFLNRLSADFIEKDERLLGLAYNTLRKKVADALVLLDKKFHSCDTGFTVAIEREELASIAGTATESLIRTLYEFRDEHLIEMKKGVITAIHTEKLQHLRR